MRRGDKTPDELDRPEGNSLVENYELHDVGHEEFVRRVHNLGFEVVEWGIDQRHDDGEDGVLYDDKMDYKVMDGDDLLALVDVKTKSSARWMGRFNERHYTHYYQHASDYGVPTFVVMFQVDSVTDEIHDEFTFELGRGGVYDRVETSRRSDAVRTFPDGNHAVLVPHEYRRTWQYFERAVETEKMKNAFDRGEWEDVHSTEDDDIPEYDNE